MRGTVLLLASDPSPIIDVDLLRANGLTVYRSQELTEALKQFEHIAPDVVVVATHDIASVTSLRREFDYATSIIVASDDRFRDAARSCGADSFLVADAPPTDLIYEIHRALILRRSGRRLPWNS
jgi:hypothetical protein